MKKSLFVALLCMGLFTACEELIYINGYIPPPVMSVYPTFLHVPAEGDSAISIQVIVDIPVEGAAVTVREECDWFVVKALSNERAVVAVAPNPADTVRLGNIVFSYDNEERVNLTARQEGRE